MSGRYPPHPVMPMQGPLGDMVQALRFIVFFYPRGRRGTGQSKVRGSGDADLRGTLPEYRQIGPARRKDVYAGRRRSKLYLVVAIAFLQKPAT